MKIQAKTIIKKGLPNHFYHEDDGFYYETLVPPIYGCSHKYENLPNDAEVIDIYICDDESNHIVNTPVIEDRIDSLSDWLTRREMRLYKAAYDWTISELSKL